MAEAKRKLTKEELSKVRSENAKKLVAEGKLGGARKGSGRPKKERAQTVVAEKVRDHQAQNIYTTLVDVMNNGKPGEQLKAALALLEIESKEHAIQSREEERMYDNRTKEQLVELAMKRLKLLEKQGFDVGSFLEGKAEEIVEQKELPAP